MVHGAIHLIRLRRNGGCHPRPEEITLSKNSYTGQFLKGKLKYQEVRVIRSAKGKPSMSSTVTPS